MEANDTNIAKAICIFPSLVKDASRKLICGRQPKFVTLSLSAHLLARQRFALLVSVGRASSSARMGCEGGPHTLWFTEPRPTLLTRIRNYLFSLFPEDGGVPNLLDGGALDRTSDGEERLILEAGEWTGAAIQ